MCPEGEGLHPCDPRVWACHPGASKWQEEDGLSWVESEVTTETQIALWYEIFPQASQRRGAACFSRCCVNQPSGDKEKPSRARKAVFVLTIQEGRNWNKAHHTVVYCFVYSSPCSWFSEDHWK